MFSPNPVDSRSTPIGYMGWDSHGNMGDDAIRDALMRSLPHLELIGLPMTGRETIRFLTHPRSRHFRNMHLLLGGGTAIGRRNWRIPLSLGLKLTGRRPAFMIGAGVEDPAFHGLHSFSSKDELARWSQILRVFDRVTVRGPRSASLLADIGIEARVVGDPALLIEGIDDCHRPPDERLIGVNLGFGSDLWSHDEGRVVKEVSTALRTLVRRHQFRVLFLVVNEADAQYAHDCRDQAELTHDECPIVRALDADSYMDAIAQCWIMISQRLHAGILAAATGIPGIMLEYQPKCRDFMESIAQPQWSVRTDQLDAAQLVDLATDLSGNRQQQAELLNASVADLRQRLHEEIVRLGKMTGYSGDR